MGDAPARTELKVTAGPIRGSRKVTIDGVAMRAVDLEPSSGEPPVILYDTSGPYTDPAARIDIRKGLEPLRAKWIAARADTVQLDGPTSRFGAERLADPKLAELRFELHRLPRRA